MHGKFFFRTLLTLAALPFILISLLSTFLFLFPPVLLQRWFVSSLASLFRPKGVRKILQSTGALIAVSIKEVYSDAALSPLVAFVLPDPRPELEQLRSLISSRLVHAEDGGGLLYPELQERIVRWWGYLFWAPTPTPFHINHHVKHLEDVEPSPPDWGEPGALESIIWRLLYKRTWEVDRPLWEFILIPNIPPGQLNPRGSRDGYPPEAGEGSMLILKIHHCLADGLSLLTILSKILDKEEFEVPRPVAFAKKDSSSRWLDAARTLLMGVKLPWELAEKLVDTVLMDRRRIPTYPKDKKGKVGAAPLEEAMVGAESPPLLVSKIKGIKKALRVDFATVLFALIAGGVRRMLEERGERPEGEMEIGFLAPRLGHPDKLRNHFRVGNTYLPMGESCPSTRLRLIQERLDGVKRSGLVYFSPRLLQLMGNFPSPALVAIKVLLRAWKGTSITLTLSNLFGPVERVSVLGSPVLEIRGGINGDGNDFGVGFLFITYNGVGRLVAGGFSKYLKSKENVQRLLEYGMEELQLLDKATF